MEEDGKTPIQKERKRIAKTAETLIEAGIYEVEGKDIVVKDPKKFFVKLSGQKNARMIYQTLSESALRVYLFLLNQYDQRKGAPKEKRYTFTQQSLGEQALGYSTTSWRSYHDEINNALSVLAAVGLVNFSVIKVGKAWYYRLDNVRTSMVIPELVKTTVDATVKDLEEHESKVEGEVLSVGISKELEDTWNRISLNGGEYWKWLPPHIQDEWIKVRGMPMLENGVVTVN